jgi:transcription elongation factor SPT5
VEIGETTRHGSTAPRHFQRGAYDGQKFGYDTPGAESAKCVLLSDPSVVEDIPAEYIRPARPDRPGQTVVVIAGEHKGAQKVTQYLNDGAWMMEPEGGDLMAMVVSEASLCRIWKT